MSKRDRQLEFTLGLLPVLMAFNSANRSRWGEALQIVLFIMALVIIGVILYRLHSNYIKGL